MSSKVPFPPPGFDDLSADEQAQYASELWDRVTLREDEISVPDWHLELLREREARSGGVVEGTTWEEFEEELNKNLNEQSNEHLNDEESEEG